jgi:hypothetical protein
MGGSKRLMTFPDASDLWILTTRNAIDISCSAGDTFDSSVLTQIQQAGIQYVVVKTPQSDTRPVECNDQVEIAQKQLDAFSKGFKTAAYCFLHFQEVDIGHGTQQARKCLKTIQAARYNSIAFVALDVEEASSISKTDAAKIVLDAGTEISSVLGKQPVIYTYLPDWQQIIGKKNVEFKGLPLWARTKGIFYDAGRNEHCGDGVPSLTPFSLPEQFGGWTALSGKQFDLGYAASGCASTFLAGVPVDFDVLDASLFPQ